MFAKKETIEARNLKMANGSFISKSTKLFGDIETDRELTIEGTLVGNVRASNGDSVVTISAEGFVEGNISAAEVIVDGVVKGDIESTVIIHCGATARVIGNIEYNEIQLALGAEVSGSLVRIPKENNDFNEDNSDSTDANSTVEPSVISNSSLYTLEE